MTSIVIINYNTKELTAQCIESIREYTDDYEIIVIDNGSRDDSIPWLEKQKDIKLICNVQNKGFPKGCNQGMEVAKGSEILLLNSDTVVTPRWLDQMRYALYSEESIGAVGCVTNYCSNNQQLNAIPYDTRTLEGLMEFADKYNDSNPQKWQYRTMLVGFCFLLKTSIYKEIGGLDERFSPGNYEDDDYSVRILNAGYKLLLCTDTYIHHYGSASFTKSLSKEELEEKTRKFNELLERNKKLFYEKWDIPMGYWKYADYKSLLKYQQNKHPDNDWRLDGKKICFIVCVEKENDLSQIRMSINGLHIPKGKFVEVLPINSSKRIAINYNIGQENSKAKYKIYVHISSLNLKSDFLVNTLNIFEQSVEYGLIKILDNRDNGNRVIVMTQYDIPWNESVDNDCSALGESQCLKFRKNGYKTIVIS